MALFSWRALEQYRMGKKKPKRKIEYPRVEPGELFTVQMPQGQQFLKDLENNKIRGVLFLGSTGKGKSSSLEDLAEFYIQRGHVVVDFYGSYWENVFWARKYPVVLVQPPSKYQVKSTSDRVTTHTWREGFDWGEVLKEAKEKKAVLVTSCWLTEDNYYLMLRDLIDALLNPLMIFPRIVVIRDLMDLLPSGLKISSSKELVELKRKMLVLVRQGRKAGNRIFADAQIAEDVLRSFRENIWVRIYKGYEGKIQGVDEDINDEINLLNEKQAVIHYKGVWFGATFPLNQCHKNENDTLEDLGLKIEKVEEPEVEIDGLPPLSNTENILERSALKSEKASKREGYYKHYQALIAIAKDEYRKAGVPETVLDEVVAVDFPPDPTITYAELTYDYIKQTLGLRKQAGSVGFNYRKYVKNGPIDNNVIERIGLRFIKHLITSTPDFPTQSFFNSGSGVRDVEFRVGRRLVASANVKLFTDERGVSREVKLTPEYRDPVHYGLIITVKPFRVKAFRGTGQPYVAAGSVSDLGWRGFVEDLRREAEKTKKVRGGEKTAGET